MVFVICFMIEKVFFIYKKNFCFAYSFWGGLVLIIWTLVFALIIFILYVLLDFV